MAAELAFVVDSLNVMGGAERVLLTALECFPGVPVFSLVYNPTLFKHTTLAGSPVITSTLNRLPGSKVHYRSYLPLMPAAIERFDLSGFERIVSFNYAVAHGVRTGPGQVHASLTHTPMRYAWRNVPLSGPIRGLPWLTTWMFNSFRRWDAAAAGRVTRLAAISQFIAGLSRAAYNRESQVIYPPVDVGRFHPQKAHGDYFVTVSRLVAHKRIDLIVEAFSTLRLPLVIVGDGPQAAQLRKNAGPEITFTGRLPDKAVAGLLAGGRGFVYASQEDFGIAMVEAQAAGIPVIALAKGAACETVRDGATGVLFPEQTSASLIGAVRRFMDESPSFCQDEIVLNAARFNVERFKSEFRTFVCGPD